MEWFHQFGMHKPPLSKETEDHELWLPPSRTSLVDQLVQAAHAHEQLVLTAEDGSGKTTLIRAVRQSLPPGEFRLTYCHNATLGRRDFYRQLCLALGLSPSATAAGVFHAVTAHVQEMGRERIHPILILDEAHLLHQDTLDHLHILLNYEWDRRALLSVFLVGLPELADRLALRRNRCLYSRLHWRLHIDPLEPADTAAYIRHRLASAGCERELLTADALAILHEATAGSMRDIDRLAQAALRAAATAGHKLVERSHVLSLIDTGARS